jgi:hypothetical protein
MLLAVKLQFDPSLKRSTKESFFIGSNNDFMLIFTPGAGIVRAQP